MAAGRDAARGADEAGEVEDGRVRGVTAGEQVATLEAAAALFAAAQQPLLDRHDRVAAAARPPLLHQLVAHRLPAAGCCLLAC